MNQPFTLFRLRPGDRRRGGSARLREHSPSDVTRFVPVWLGAACAAVALLVAWKVAPPAATGVSLALPHSRAGLTCANCHKPDAPSASAAGACKGCHGVHRLRARHQALADEKRIGCVDCHDVHGADQGIRFGKEGPLRYGVGAWSPIAASAIPTSSPAANALLSPADRTLTVVLVPLARCGKCHDLGARADPIQRCRSEDLAPLAGRAPSLCFDEHSNGHVARAGAAASSGVCSANHAGDRLALWEIARPLVHAVPEPPRPSVGGGHAPWLVSAFGGGAFGMLAGGLVLQLARRRREQLRKKKLADLASAKPPDRKRLPVIDATTCLGCYACVDACPYDVLSVQRYVAVVDRADACCGLTLCEQVCPNGSLRMDEGTPLDERPLLGEGFEAKDAPGIYLAGDITGVPLIKNAILHGTSATEQIHARLPKKHAMPLDLLIIGAGPAGIAAALRAKELGLRFEVIEQGTVAQSIKSFPRGKLVFDQPLELPVAGKLWLEESSKEELLAKWLRIVRAERLPISEGHRFLGLDRIEGGFEIAIEGPEGTDTRRAARVLLAIGMRGSPRKLAFELPEGIESKVFYHLADARSLAGQKVLVVGLGDSAMETAIALAHQPGTEVAVCYRGAAITRGKRRNIDELNRLIDAGRIRLFFSADVRKISTTSVELTTPSGPERLTNDAVLVMIGSIAPTALLAKAGIGKTLAPASPTSLA